MRGLLVALLLLAGIHTVAAGQLQLRVVDDQDQPLANAVVEVWPLHEDAPLSARPRTALLEQIDKAFVFPLGSADEDAMIVSSIIELGHFAARRLRRGRGDGGGAQPA